MLNLLDSAVLEHGQVGRGCRFATYCSGQICSATKTCSWNPVQIGECSVGAWSGWQELFATSCSGQICFARPALEPCAAGQPLASELGWFDQCSWLLSTPIAVWDVRFAMLQPCQVTALLGNKLETCSVSAAWQVGKFKVLDLLDSAVLEHGQVGRGCRFEHLAVARSALQPRPAVGTLCRLV